MCAASAILACVVHDEDGDIELALQGEEGTEHYRSSLPNPSIAYSAVRRTHVWEERECPVGCAVTGTTDFGSRRALSCRQDLRLRSGGSRQNDDPRAN